MNILNTFTSHNKIYSVDLMFRWAKEKKPKIHNISVKKLAKNMFHACWGSERNELVKPIDVINNKDISPGHYYKIKHTDLKYPIFITGNYLVIDGMHRLSKSIMEGVDTIKCYIMDKKTLDKFHVGNDEKFWESNETELVKTISKDLRRRKINPVKYLLDVIYDLRF